MTWAADHLMAGRAGGDHGVDRIFLFDEEIDEERAVMAARGLYGGFEVASVADDYAGNAVSVGELDEVRADQRGRFIVALVEELLPLADHAQIAVVDDRDVDVELLLHDGGELTGGHLEAAVAGDDPDFLVRAGDFGADACGQCEAHRSQAAGGDERARQLVVVVLRLPHLMLAYVGGDDRAALGDAPEVVHDMGSVEVSVVGKIAYVADGGSALAGGDGVEPRRAVSAREQRQKLFEDLAEIADESN